MDPKGGGTCTQINSGFKGSEVSGGQRELLGGRSDPLTRASLAPRAAAPPAHRDGGRRGLGRPPLVMSPFPGSNGQRERGPRKRKGRREQNQAQNALGTAPARLRAPPVPAPVQTFWPAVALRCVPGSREGPAEVPGRPPLPAAGRPAPLPVPPEPPARMGEPRARQREPRARCGRAPGAFLPAARATLQPRGGRPWPPWVAGAGEPHLLRRVQALPLDGRGHWGGGWRARRRGRSLCGAGLAGCRGSDPLGCSGAAAAAPAPPLAPALRRRARPSALKDSHRAPFKRQRERANHRAAGARRPRRGPGRAAWPRRLQLLLLLRT